MDFQGRAHKPAQGAFLRDIDSKIVGIPQCRTLGTVLVRDMFVSNCNLSIFIPATESMGQITWQTDS